MLEPGALHPELDATGKRRALRRLVRELHPGRLVLLFLVSALVARELRTSALQAWLISRYVAHLSYRVEEGPSPEVAFPAGGPFDERRGYSRIPEFAEKLEQKGFRVVRQARVSEELARLVNWGIAPPFAEPGAAALVVRDEDGARLFDAAAEDRQFRAFEEIPALVVETLLFLENRELPEPRHPQANPAIEWDRLAKAGLLWGAAKLGLPFSVQGGSTLATQLEKYRHSPEGRTESSIDKVRQVAAATLKAYRDGFDTRPWRKRIVLDYLNTVPLAAARGHGEVHGLGEALWMWFGWRLPEFRAALAREGSPPEKIAAYKAALALIASLPAPTSFLVHDRVALAERVDRFARALAAAGVLDREFAERVWVAPLGILPDPPRIERVPFPPRKATNTIRRTVAELLDVDSLYAVDRLHLEVESTIDTSLQSAAIDLFRTLRDPEFVATNGLVREHVLETGDPANVGYSLLLFEKTPEGNALRVQADNLDRPFDPNVGMKLELGSTAKLRTLAHYLEVMADLHGELSGKGHEELVLLRDVARDPLARFAAELLLAEPRLALGAFLERALDRRYSASPYETFFTGGGLHRFRNFDEAEDELRPTLRYALRASTNLVFVRLMRDLVRYHTARLPYDAWRALNVPDDPMRLAILHEAAERESRRDLERATGMLRNASEPEILERLLGGPATDARDLALLFYAWNPDADEDELYRWLRTRFQGDVTEEQVRALADRYGAHQLDLPDAAYQLRQSPMIVWLAGEMLRHPERSFDDLVVESGAARSLTSNWLFRTRNRFAQNLRIRTRLEADAFARMTSDWQRLGFPFARLVPSYATALGNSSDRPAALADLMGIILNDGVRRSRSPVRALTFARGTPYETALVDEAPAGERVMNASVARVLRRALEDVVEAGTARQLAGRFVGADGRVVPIGGKTGSGDNRYKVFGRGGWLKSSRAVNRTAAFVFYVGDRYFGVLTAFVEGPGAEGYRFTSKLPVAVLDLFAPTLNARLGEGEQMQAEWPPSERRELDPPRRESEPVEPTRLGRVIVGPLGSPPGLDLFL